MQHPLHDSPIAERAAHLTRRQFFGRTATGIGTAALASVLGPRALAAPGPGDRTGGLPGVPHFAPKAKRVIYLCMSGAPSQFEAFDWKPKLRDMFDQELPDSIRNGQRITTMTSGQSRFPIAPSKFDFARHGEAGTEVCETLPWTARMVDDLCVMRSVHTDAINHDPAITFMQTGSEQPGRPSFGAWLSYGLGSMNRDLPSFVVMTPRWKGRREAQALYQRLWGSGFLPSEHQGVALRAGGDPVLMVVGGRDDSLADQLDAACVDRHRVGEGAADVDPDLELAEGHLVYRYEAAATPRPRKTATQTNGRVRNRIVLTSMP